VSKVFFSVTLSLDGFIAPEERPGEEGKKRWFAQWGELQKYVFRQRFFREKLKIGEGGETGEDNRILEGVFRRTGVTIIGKRMFDAGEHSWPEEAPFETPVFVVTKQVRDPWERKGGTTFYFVNDGIESALERARAVAGDRDIRIGGGGHTILAYLNAGLIDEFSIGLSPVFFGTGTRLFERVDETKIGLEIESVVGSPLVTHLNYKVRKL